MKGYQLATYCDIDTTTLQAMLNLYNKAFNRFKSDADKTRNMVGKKGPNTNAETAAMIVVTNALLNLDEVVTSN